MSLVRSTCARVAARGRHVGISQDAVRMFVQRFGKDAASRLCQKRRIDMNIHFEGDPGLTAQYLLVLDAINFCFWPDKDLEYHHLSIGLKNTVTRDPRALDAENLKRVKGSEIRGWLDWPRPLPLEEERARLLREVGYGLDAFEGRAEKLIRAANKSVLALVTLLTAHFPGFRDHAICQGEQIFLLKRAQIFAGDVWGTFGGEGLGEFDDIDQLTMFPDYRVPQILQQHSILQYSEELQKRICAGDEVEAGSPFEIEIRACSVIAVERLKDAFREIYGEELTPMSVQLDWWLWETAEGQQLDYPHHCTLSPYY